MNRDFVAMLAALCAAGVEFLVVGAYAMAARRIRLIWFGCASGQRAESAPPSTRLTAERDTGGGKTREADSERLTLVHQRANS